MSSNKKYIGIDGCKDGWFCVCLNESDDWSYSVVSSPSDLVELVQDAHSVLIDIPVGLLDKGNSERECDKAARIWLSPKRSSSVFPVPLRQTLLTVDYETALQINRKISGRGISLQSWFILPKIREVDNMLSTHKELQGVVRECHPELCFCALNSRAAMQFNKKKEEGKQERLAVLQNYFKASYQLFEQASSDFLRRQLAHDDIIDAMVCAVTAKYGYDNYLTLPPDPQKDTNGLAMEIVYWLP